jgi:methylmalonyl-CoA mutase
MSQNQNLFEEFPPVSREEWEHKIEEDLHGADYKTQLKWHTGEGIDVLPFYRSDDFEAPPMPVTTLKNDWEICQPIVEQDVEKANEIAQQALQNGADSLSFMLDIRRTAGNIGGDLRGVAIQNQEAFDQLLDGIDPEKTPLHFTAGLNSPILLAMLYNKCESLHLNSANISGSLLYDPYAFVLTNGLLPKNEADFIDETRQILTFCSHRMPQMKCLGVDAGIYHHAGAAIVQEMGYALAAGSEYLAALSKNGLNIDTIASAVHFNFSIGSNYFLEIAKFRAIRKLWRMILDEYGVDEDQGAYLHGSTSKRNKSAVEPYINMLRTTTEGMAAAIAGCDTVSIYPFDDVFAQPHDFSRRIARNNQILAKEEANFDKVADPSAGSCYIETVTEKLAEAAWECFREVEQQGGLLKSIRGGYPQTAIKKERKKREKDVAQRKRILVGVNQYPFQQKQSANNQSKPVVSLLESGSNTDIDHSKLMASLGKALKNGCALGDLVPNLFDLGAENILPLHLYREPQMFEELRKAAENHSTIPRVLTIPIGNKKIRKARSAFAVNFLGCGGYYINDPLGFDSVNEAITEIENSHPDMVVLCSSDKEYEQLVPEFCNLLHELGQNPIAVLAGYPEENIEQYRKKGIDEFIYAGCNVLETLRRFHKKLGINNN